MVGAESYQRAFDRPLPGFWLPECGYYPGLEDFVQEAGGRYFFLESHGILNAAANPRYGYLAPLACANGVAAFGRDPAAGRQVWSADEGYPGDYWYRDFYRDIGFDLDFDTIKPYVLDGHTRIFTGFKYYRITGKTDEKEPYEPARARERAAVHAGDFLERQVAAVERYAPAMDQPPLIVALYDAELFGHWWFEGPQWLDFLIRKLASDQDTVELVTPGQYLERHPTQQCAQPSASSWGDKGYSDFWLNPGNDWIYRHLHEAAARMKDLADTHRDAVPGSLEYRALQQAARSLLLAQSSDWAFIMKTGTAVDYAYGRTRDHIGRFHYLADAVSANAIDEQKLRALEAMDNIFPDIDFRVYA
jgi:1,4-alpha-glucan branching enzyme